LALQHRTGQLSLAKVEAEKRVRWDGIRGGAAQKHMRLIRPGDTILAYHSAPEKSVVGIAEAVTTSYPEPGVPAEERDKWHVIDVTWSSWLPIRSRSQSCVNAVPCGR